MPKKRVSKEHNLAIAYPHLTADWHEDNAFSPYDITPNSQKEVKWKCKDCNWVWTTTASARTFHSTGCPKCSIGITPDHNLAVLYPHLLNEWDDDADPRYVGPKSDYTAQWKCSCCGHKWQTTVQSRAEGAGCLKCSHSVDYENSLAYLHPPFAR